VTKGRQNLRDSRNAQIPRGGLFGLTDVSKPQQRKDDCGYDDVRERVQGAYEIMFQPQDFG
jgi:hypothetical protein